MYFWSNFTKISKLTLKLLNLLPFTWCEALFLNFFDFILVGWGSKCRLGRFNVFVYQTVFDIKFYVQILVLSQKPYVAVQ